MKTGIIDTGGGMRGVYSAGALDCCLDRCLHFGLAIGIVAALDAESGETKYFGKRDMSQDNYDTLTRDKDALNRLYEKGLRDGAKIEKFLRGN